MLYTLLFYVFLDLWGAKIMNELQKKEKKAKKIHFRIKS